MAGTINAARPRCPDDQPRESLAALRSDSMTSKRRRRDIIGKHLSKDDVHGLIGHAVTPNVSLADLAAKVQELADEWDLGQTPRLRDLALNVGLMTEEAEPGGVVKRHMRPNVDYVQVTEYPSRRRDVEITRADGTKSYRGASPWPFETTNRLLSDFHMIRLLVHGLLTNKPDPKLSSKLRRLGGRLGEYLTERAPKKSTASEQQRDHLDSITATPPIPSPVTSQGDPQPDSRPSWDDERGLLKFGPVTCRDYSKRRAPNQERLLRAFEEADWPHRIKNPFPKDRPGNRSAAGVLNQTLRGLNRRLSDGSPIQFRAGGDGIHVVWEAQKHR